MLQMVITYLLESLFLILKTFLFLLTSLFMYFFSKFVDTLRQIH